MKKNLKCCKKSSFLQTDISNIADSFIFLTISLNSCILENEMKQVINRIKADKASDIFDILNRMLQANLAKLISTLMCLFNICVTLEYHLKQFKKTQMIVLCKSKKSNYINSKMYWFIALLNIMSKALKLIMIKRLSNIVETHYMLSKFQMKVKCKWFVISILDLLIIRLQNQVHDVHAKSKHYQSV